jgi:hypothetical protein
MRRSNFRIHPTAFGPGDPGRSADLGSEGAFDAADVHPEQFDEMSR